MTTRTDRRCLTVAVFTDDGSHIEFAWQLIASD